MNRKVYESNGIVSLSEYVKSEDDKNRYECWLDEEVQRGYNYIIKENLEEFCARAVTSRFLSTIIRCEDGAVIGYIFVSPEDSPPDLAIMLNPAYRKKGYGTMAFSLGVKYCFEVLKLDKIYAGCYPDNEPSAKMLQKCGFKPHPEGNLTERHYITGKEIIQQDFVKFNED